MGTFELTGFSTFATKFGGTQIRNDEAEENSPKLPEDQTTRPRSNESEEHIVRNEGNGMSGVSVSHAYEISTAHKDEEASIEGWQSKEFQTKISTDP